VIDSLEWAYPLPDDDFLTMRRILEALPERVAMEVRWERLPHYVVAVANPVAAVYLRCAVEDGRPTDDDGHLVVGPNEIWVSEDERSECEKILADMCQSPAVWWSFAAIAFKSIEAHRDFGAEYKRLTGLPHAAKHL
jgi:hypothetical protein